MDGKRMYVDIDNGLARVRGNKVLYKKMLGLFVTSTEFQNLENAIAAQDWEKGGDSAHTLKGMAGNLSLTAVFEDSAELMSQMREGAPDESTLVRYRDSLAKTLSELAEIVPTL